MAELKRAIGKKTLFFLGLNAIIGAEIFFIPGIAYSYAGASAIISWAIMAVIAIIMSTYFAELVSCYPKAGGVYEYSKILGKFTSFIVGWITWIIASMIISISIVGALQIFEIEMFTKIIISLIAIILFGYISFRGIGESSKLLLVLGFLTISLPITIAILGIPAINIENFIFTLSLSPILLAIFVSSQVFFGWESLTFLAEEVKDKKILSKMFISITLFVAIVTIFYVTVLYGVAGNEIIGNSAGIVASKIFGSFGEKIFLILMFIPLIGTAASWMVSSPRLLYAMARDKVLIQSFKKIHKKYKTPYIAIIAQALISCFIVLSGFGIYELIMMLIIPLVILEYLLVFLSVIKIQKLKFKKSYRSPFGRSGAIFIIIFLIIILAYWVQSSVLAFSSFFMGVILAIIGIPLYFIIKLRTDKKFIEKFFDRISFAWDKLFGFWYTEEDAKEVISKLKIKNNYKVLDFGCGTGRTTVELAKKLKRGTVVAIDLSRKQLEKAYKKVEQSKVTNVIFIKEDDLARFPKNSFDAVTAVAVLEHFERPEKMLKKMLDLLKPNGYFSFLSFGSSFGIPAQNFLKNEETIKRTFKKIGYDVKVKKEWRLFNEYWFIWGKKSAKK